MILKLLFYIHIKKKQTQLLQGILIWISATSQLNGKGFFAHAKELKMNKHTQTIHFIGHTLKITYLSFTWKNYDHIQFTQIKWILCCLKIKIAHLQKINIVFLIILIPDHCLGCLGVQKYKSSTIQKYQIPSFSKREVFLLLS